MKIYRCELLGTGEVRYMLSEAAAMAFARGRPRVLVAECTLKESTNPHLQDLLAELATWCDIQTITR